MNRDLELARATPLFPILEVAERLGLTADDLIPFGSTKAKLTRGLLERLDGRPQGKLVLVSAISPTPAGEGKTTTSIGLHDGLCRLGQRSIVCLREPSLGPCFGLKGGATGGGRSQVAPMEDINLHFTGDFHAVGAAHNLLSALIDNHLYWGNSLGLDPRRISWPRVVDMNDRALRKVVVALEGNGDVRESHFDITVASEVMAILCLARDGKDLEQRLGRIIVGQTRDKQPVTAADLSATGAMMALLREAQLPNLVQTLEHNPALIHGGPFANIAHGCNSVIATRTALRLADIVVTEAGFGADLGAEKFLDIKCRQSGLRPDAAVLVATVRALKLHGGVDKRELDRPDLAALERGAANLERHLENLRSFGLPVVVAVNRFASDSEAELALLREIAARHGANAIEATHHRDGGAGAEALASEVLRLTESPSRVELLYPDELGIWEKIERVARRIYRAEGITGSPAVRARSEALTNTHGRLPVCIAKTQYSFSADPSQLGAPSGFELPVRELRLAAGAGFVVAVCGDTMTMPGLPREPAAHHIGVDERGEIIGLS